MTDATRVYAFGPYRLDANERVLSRDGQPITLTLKAFATLLALVEHHGHIVDKAALMERVWPDTAVEEGNLTQNIYSLRKLLGDRLDSRVAIETVPRRGYRLVGDVTVLDEATTRVPVEAGPAVASENIAETRPTGLQPSSVETAWVRIHRVARGRVWWGAAALLAAALGILQWANGWPVRSVAARFAESPSPTVTAVPLTSLTGEKFHPALSHDGSQVAFVWNRDGDGHQVYTKRIGASADAMVQLTKRSGGASYPSWSPDGRSIAFVRRFIDDDGGPRTGVFVVSSLGGSERLLWLDKSGSLGPGLDWSTDGARLIVSTRSAIGHPRRLLLISVASGESHWLTSPTSGPGEGFAVFSPAGDAVAFVRDTGSEIGVHVLDLRAGEPSRVLFAGRDIRRLAWTADGRSLVFECRQGAGRTLWKIAVSGGEPATVPGVGEGAGDPAISRTTGRLAFTQALMDQNLYRAELGVGREQPIRQLLVSTRGDVQGDVSPDGSRIAFVTARSGQAELWIMKADGTTSTQVTDLRTSCSHPRWSPDGRFVAFTALVAGTSGRHVYVVDAGGGPSRRLTSEPSDDHWPTWSHDGRWIYFMSHRNGDREIWKVPNAGGPALQVTKDNGRKAWESSDGRFLYYSTSAAVWRIPTAGGERTRLFDFPQGTGWGGEWVLSKEGIYWVNEASPRPSIEFFAFANGRTTRIFTPPGVYDDGGGFSVSPDGRWIVFGQKDYDTSDIMLIEGFR